MIQIPHSEEIVKQKTLLLTLEEGIHRPETGICCKLHVHEDFVYYCSFLVADSHGEDMVKKSRQETKCLPCIIAWEVGHNCMLFHNHVYVEFVPTI